MKKFPGKLTRGKYGYIHLTDEQVEWLKRWFPVTENRRLAEAMGMSKPTLHRYARQYGLTKSAAGLRAIMVRTGQRIKETCERNGYYESLRGKPVSDACAAGRRAYLDSDRYRNPFSIMKEKNPKKYQELLAERRELRLKTVRKERAKDLFGLPRETRLHLPMRPYTHAQANKRWNARKKGYIVPDDVREGHGQRWVIYYDDRTRRGARFEKLLIKAGFKVERWTDCCEQR